MLAERVSGLDGMVEAALRRIEAGDSPKEAAVAVFSPSELSPDEVDRLLFDGFLRRVTDVAHSRRYDPPAPPPRSGRFQMRSEPVGRRYVTLGRVVYVDANGRSKTLLNATFDDYDFWDRHEDAVQEASRRRQEFFRAAKLELTAEGKSRPLELSDAAAGRLEECARGVFG